MLLLEVIQGLGAGRTFELSGEVVAVGTPDDLRRHPTSHTGLALREYDASVATSACHRATSVAATYVSAWSGLTRAAAVVLTQKSNVRLKNGRLAIIVLLYSKKATIHGTRFPPQSKAF